MIVVGIESSHSPVLDGRDGGAVSGAKRAIATDEFLRGRRFVGIRHDQYFVIGQTRRGCTCSAVQIVQDFELDAVPAVRAETLGLRLGSLLFVQLRSIGFPDKSGTKARFVSRPCSGNAAAEYGWA